MINSAQVILQAKLSPSQPNGMHSNHSKKPITSPNVQHPLKYETFFFFFICFITQSVNILFLQ
jgi:hypothetical protein